MAEETDNEGGQVVSILDYLNEVEEEELGADLILGGDEGKECTYSNGYMKRQAIFSCLTCTPDGNSGVCTACSLSCHDGHEVVELWTKRNFRCDCGNSKFGEFFCKLFPGKDAENDQNSYNHNFRGLYCTCERPYPDPDVEEQVEMIQCCMCEDWFHVVHLGLASPDEIPRDQEGVPQYEDFMCKTCSAVCSFLLLYPQIMCATGVKPGAGPNNKDKDVVEDVCPASSSGKNENVTKDISADLNSGSSSDGKNIIVEENSNTNTSGGHPTNDANPENCNTNISADQHTNNANSHVNCLLGDSPLPDGVDSKPLFLSKIWRDVLCRCDKCLDMYKQKQIGYIVDKEDSIAEYERTAKQKREENLQKQENAELNLFNNLGHVEKIEILNGLADMRTELQNFMETFDPSKAVTPEDVHQIFDNLAKKRKRTD